MAIVNRDLDSSEQIHVVTCLINDFASGVSVGFMTPGIVNGQTYPCLVVPFPASLSSANIAAWGLSGTSIVGLYCYRFTAGGLTSIPLGLSLSLTAFGTSGALGFSLTGATNQLQTGDQLVIAGTGSGAVSQAVLTLGLHALQDIRSTFGLQS